MKTDFFNKDYIKELEDTIAERDAEIVKLTHRTWELEDAVEKRDKMLDDIKNQFSDLEHEINKIPVV